jgi:RHS repeat-associated protein
MDSLGYFYYAGTNKLRKVTDNVSATTTTVDINNQTNDENYVYDEIGNLITDKSENITSIKWNVYGKIEEINKTGTASYYTSKIEYSYDANGHRIGKIVHRNDGFREYTCYVRDASGNVLALYTTSGTASNLSNLVLNVTVRFIYGSMRIGAYFYNSGVDGGASDISSYTAWNGRRGVRKYELSNHLGNVLSMVLDKTKPIVSSDNSAKIEYNVLHLAHNSYYPFGMLMSARSFSQSLNSSRYGFNGQEKSDEISGTGNSYTAEFWQYDARIGRRWNVNPIPKTTVSSYVVLGNNPISFIDPNGADWYKHNKTGKAKWFDGSGEHKKYARVGGEDHVFDGGSMDEVVVTATARKKGMNWGWSSSSKSNKGAWRNELYTNFQKLNSGQNVDPSSLSYVSPSYLGNNYQADQDDRTMSHGALGLMASPVLFLAAVESGGMYYLGQGTSWVGRRYGSGFVTNVYKMVLENKGDVSSIDWFDVGLSTVYPLKKFGVWGSLGAEVFNSAFDFKGGKFSAAFVNKTNTDFIIDLTFGAFKSGMKSTTGILDPVGGATQFNRELGIDVVSGILKGELKDK